MVDVWADKHQEILTSLVLDKPKSYIKIEMFHLKFLIKNMMYGHSLTKCHSNGIYSF